MYFTIVPSLLLRATSLCRRATASFSLNKRGEKTSESTCDPCIMNDTVSWVLMRKGKLWKRQNFCVLSFCKLTNWGHSGRNAKQRACSSVHAKIAYRKQKAGHPHPRYTLKTHPLTQNTQTYTQLNKEIDCARPIRFPREGIPGFNGINLGTLARIIKNSGSRGLPRYQNNYITACFRGSTSPNKKSFY